MPIGNTQIKYCHFRKTREKKTTTTQTHKINNKKMQRNIYEAQYHNQIEIIAKLLLKSTYFDATVTKLVELVDVVDVCDLQCNVHQATKN